MPLVFSSLAPELFKRLDVSSSKKLGQDYYLVKPPSVEVLRRPEAELLICRVRARLDPNSGPLVPPGEISYVAITLLRIDRPARNQDEAAVAGRANSLVNKHEGPR